MHICVFINKGNPVVLTVGTQSGGRVGEAKGETVNMFSEHFCIA